MESFKESKKKITINNFTKSNKLSALEISLTIGCKLKCEYCPQDLLLSKYYRNSKCRKSKLSFTDFKKVVDEKMESGATISFGGMSEPFLNDEFADMLVYASEKGHKISLYTTIVGMTHKDFEKIKDIKFDRFVLHIPDKENKSKFEITNEYIQLLKLLHKSVNIDFYSCHGKVDPIVAQIIDKTKNSGIDAQDRAGNLKLEGFKPLEHKGEIVCYKAWSSLAMNLWEPVLFPDGSLVLCVQDYGMKHILGNLFTQSWKEIQEGEEYQKFIKGLKDDNIDILCRKCICAKKFNDLPPIQLKNTVNVIKNNEFDKFKLSTGSLQFVEKFLQADHICVFGLGKLFKEHFFQEYWNEGLNVTLLSDNSEEYRNVEINGIECIEPNELSKYKSLLVILFVKNNIDSIKRQLGDLGINNIMTIGQVVDSCNRLCKELKHII